MERSHRVRPTILQLARVRKAGASGLAPVPDRALPAGARRRRPGGAVSREPPSIGEGAAPTTRRKGRDEARPRSGAGRPRPRSRRGRTRGPRGALDLQRRPRWRGPIERARRGSGAQPPKIGRLR